LRQPIRNTLCKQTICHLVTQTPARAHAMTLLPKNGFR
jgi:hypothetical protein